MLRLRLITSAPENAASQIAEATSKAVPFPSLSRTRSGRMRASGLISTMTPASWVPCP